MNIVCTFTPQCLGLVIPTAEMGLLRFSVSPSHHSKHSANTLLSSTLPECGSFTAVIFKILKRWRIIGIDPSELILAINIQFGYSDTSLSNISSSFPVAHSIEPWNLDSVVKGMPDFAYWTVKSFGVASSPLCTPNIFTQCLSPNPSSKDPQS